MPAAIREINITLFAPILSESFPSLGAEMILESPDAEKTSPEMSAM